MIGCPLDIQPSSILEHTARRLRNRSITTSGSNSLAMIVHTNRYNATPRGQHTHQADKEAIAVLNGAGKLVMESIVETKASTLNASVHNKTDLQWLAKESRGRRVVAVGSGIAVLGELGLIDGLKRENISLELTIQCEGKKMCHREQ
jgi:transcriptional regulator GlxA family with amidase domain